MEKQKPHQTTDLSESVTEARMAIICRKLRARDAGVGDVTCGAEDGA